MLASERLRLRKNSKLLRKVEFERLRSAPFRRAGALMAVSVAQGEEKFAKCGVICSRKFSLLAVERNRARRLIWESFRLLGRRIQACSMVIIPRRRIKQASQEMVLKELSEHLAAARVLTTDPQKAPADLPPEL
ncbi:MAG: ribonuclease P protein component [Lentisphaerae bacterium]|nr:ribonuclease P protein component [Lentisphaerota bacterium]